MQLLARQAKPDGVPLKKGAPAAGSADAMKQAIGCYGVLLQLLCFPHSFSSMSGMGEQGPYQSTPHIKMNNIK
jgi:hypothetical protein